MQADGNMKIFMPKKEKKEKNWERKENKRESRADILV